jgi:hypothetical protein
MQQLGKTYFYCPLALYHSHFYNNEIKNTWQIDVIRPILQLFMQNLKKIVCSTSKYFYFTTLTY